MGHVAKLRVRIGTILLALLLHACGLADGSPFITPDPDNASPLKVRTGYGVNGVVLWLAADSGVTLDQRSQVILLADRTGNFTLTPGIPGCGPTFISQGLHGHPLFCLDRNQSLYTPCSFGRILNHDMTFIVVAMTVGAWDYEQFSLYLGQNKLPHVNRTMGIIEGGREIFDGQFVTCLGAPMLRNVFFVSGASINSSLNKVAFYRNGRHVATSGITQQDGSTFEPISGGITMGAASAPICGWNGDIAEELVYDHQLSATEMRKVSSALCAKYDLFDAPQPAIPVPEVPPPTSPPAVLPGVD